MKKILVLGMVVVMSLAMLVGCGQEQPVQDQQASVPSQEQPGAVVEDGVVMDPAQANLISEDEAKQIVLNKVDGAVAEDIWAFDLDYDDGRWKYEGEIHQDDWEYEFEIDAENGNVIGWEKDHIYD